MPPQAFLPLLHDAAAAHPEALFLRLALGPAEVAAVRSGSQAPAPAATAAAVAGAPPPPGPGTCADRLELAQSLGIGSLPCTLLLRGERLLARLQVGAEGGAEAGDAAAAAAQELAAAMLAAGVSWRMQHADCAPAGGGVAFASAP